VTRLTKKQILQMHKELIMQTGGLDGIRDEFLLQQKKSVRVCIPLQTASLVLILNNASEHLFHRKSNRFKITL